MSGEGGSGMTGSRRPRWGLVLLAVVAVALAGWAVIGRQKPAKPNRPTVVPVLVAKAELRDVPVTVTALGAARAWQGVLIRAQVGGVLRRVVVEEGAEVKAGQLLAEIDSAPYRAVLPQAQGALARDKAQLQLARVDLARYRTLAATNFIAQQKIDSQLALVSQYEATVRIDEGSVAAAQVNMDRTRILAPLSGRVGVRLVDPGNVVSATDAAGIVSINQIEPIAVTFTVPQGDFRRLSDVSAGFTRPLAAEALSQETGQSLGVGQLLIADNQVDTATGTVRLKAKFPNTDRRLWPGQFISVKLTLETLNQAVTIPAKAVNQGPKGAFAFVVDGQRKAAMRPLKVMTTDGDNAAVEGIKAGETVVIDGQMTLKERLGGDRPWEGRRRPAGRRGEAGRMNVSAPFIRRPVATSLIAAAMLVFGVAAFLNLPVSALPNTDMPTISVSASLPGANPETMASNVATPLERQFSLIPGLTQMTSVSSNGATSITLQFSLDRSSDSAAQEVQAAISAASGQLPNNLPAAPSFRKVNPGESPILALALTSETMPLAQVSDFADNVLGQQISRIRGVGQVNVNGAQKPAVRIRIDPRKAAAMGLQLDAIRQQVAAATVNAPKGVINGGDKSFTVYANDQITDVAAWDNLVVGYRNGAPIRVRDLGGAVAGVENNQVGAWVYPGAHNPDQSMPGGRGVMLFVMKEPGANVIETVDLVKAALPALQASMPPGININVLVDRTQSIRASVFDVEMTLLVTIVLVVAVIFLFLRDYRATLIPSAVIPLALMGTSAVMYVLGFYLDNLSLMAMTIAVGFIVDDAIVMVEVIWRRIEEGEHPVAAAMEGSREVGFTILSISISLLAVLIPLVFMDGVVGRLMKEFAVTLGIAVALSVLISLTLTPMMCALFLRKPRPAANPFIRGLERGFAWIEVAYARALDVVLRHMRVTLAIFLSTVVATGILYATTPTGFFPQQDIGTLQGQISAPQDASFTATGRKAEEVAAIVRQDPDIITMNMFVQPQAPNQVVLNAALKTIHDGRRSTPDEVIARLRPKMAKVVGVQTSLQANQDIRIGGRVGGAQYQYTLADTNLAELNEWTPKLLAALQTLPQLKDVTSDQRSRAAAVRLTIDRDAAARFGISPADIDAAIYNQVGQRQVAQYFTQVNNYRVIVEAPPEMQVTPELFNSIYLMFADHRPRGAPVAVREDRPPRHGNPQHQPPGPAPRHHPVVQPCAGRGAGRSHPRHRGRAGQAGGAGDAHRVIPRLRPGFPGIAGEPTHPDHRRVAGGLCDPGHPL